MTVGQILEQSGAARVWLHTMDAMVEDLREVTLDEEKKEFLFAQPAQRCGDDLIDPRDGGRWLTILS